MHNWCKGWSTCSNRDEPRGNEQSLQQVGFADQATGGKGGTVHHPSSCASIPCSMKESSWRGNQNTTLSRLSIKVWCRLGRAGKGQQGGLTQSKQTQLLKCHSPEELQLVSLGFAPLTVQKGWATSFCSLNQINSFRFLIQLPLYFPSFVKRNHKQGCLGSKITGDWQHIWLNPCL